VHGGLEEIHALEHLRIDAADGSLDGYLEKVEKARTFPIWQVGSTFIVRRAPTLYGRWSAIRSTTT